MTQHSTDKALDQKEAEHAIRNYTRVPNMLVDGYSELHPQDKWLFVCLDRLCGKEKNRYLSLRYISKKTGFSPSVLSDDKKNGKIGMIMRLHNAGLIHAEIKRRKNSDGELEKNAQYHITITDTWALNYAFYNDPVTCSDSEQVSEEDSKPVLNQNEPVLFQNGIDETCSEIERTCSDSGTIVRLHNKTTDISNITDKNNNPATNVADLLSSIEKLTEEELALLREKLLPKNASPQETLPPEKPVVASPPSKETGKGKGRGRGRTTNQEEIPLTLQGQHIIDLYGSYKGRKVTRTEETIKAANNLGDTVASDEDFLEVLKAIDNDKFLKERKVRTDLDFVFRKYDGFLDTVMKDRKGRASGAPTTDYNEVAGMTDEQRAAYKRQQEEKREKQMPKAVREEMMKLSPEARIDFIRKWKQEHQQAALA